MVQPGADSHRPSMRSHGFTVPEMATALLLFATLLGMAAPRLSGFVEGAATRSAREALVGALVRTRMEAVRRGGATLTLQRRPPTAIVEVGGDSVYVLGLDVFGVELALPHDRARHVFRFDALGLGVLSGGTVELRRGGRTARVVVSGYGRVRRP